MDYLSGMSCRLVCAVQRLIDRILAGIQWESCLVYYNHNIIVLGRDVPQMLEWLGQVFNRLHQANLKRTPGKCMHRPKQPSLTNENEGA